MLFPRTDTSAGVRRYRTFAILALFGVVVLLQTAGGAYQSEFGSHPDEAAHVVTGLMVYDYLMSFPWASPMQFAETYYLHYPKVAFGHWPPVFYLIQALWMSTFGATRVSLLLLMASFCTALAVILYTVARRFFPPPLSSIAVAGLLCVPAVQQSTTAVMVDLPLAVFVFGAALAFGRYLESAHLYHDAMVFGTLASLAILTKGNGLLLVLVPGLSLLFLRRWRPLCHPSFWLPVGVVVLLCLPFYWLTFPLTDKWVQSHFTSGVMQSALRGARHMAVTPW